MNKKTPILCALGFCILCSCLTNNKETKKEKWELSSCTSEALVVHDDRPYAEEDSLYIASFRSFIDKEMKRTVGHSAIHMNSGGNESLLGNMTADAMHIQAKKLLGIEADIAVMNQGGLRNAIGKGALLAQDIFYTYPFDNALSIAYLKGKDLLELFKNLEVGRAHALSNARIKVDKKNIIYAQIGGKDVDPNQTYSVVSIDYLIDGGDNSNAFKHAIKVESSNILLRDAIMDYVQTKENKGEMLSAKLENRVIIN